MEQLQTFRRGTLWRLGREASIEELMKANGKYAAMYELQAVLYAQGK